MIDFSKQTHVYTINLDFWITCGKHFMIFFIFGHKLIMVIL